MYSFVVCLIVMSCNNNKDEPTEKAVVVIYFGINVIEF